MEIFEEKFHKSMQSKIAVLVGDYLLSKGLLLSIDNGDFDLLKIISVAVREIQNRSIKAHCVLW